MEAAALFPGILAPCPLALTVGVPPDPLHPIPFILVESPCLQNPYQNDRHCQEQGAHVTCECDFGYRGDLYTELWDVLSPEIPGKNFIPGPVSSQFLPHEQPPLLRVCNVHI